MLQEGRTQEVVAFIPQHESLCSLYRRTGDGRGGVSAGVGGGAELWEGQAAGAMAWASGFSGSSIMVYHTK